LLTRENQISELEAGLITQAIEDDFDYASEQVLLRKVGGGYIFIHRMLLEYFANLEVPAPAPRQA
jgi:hypothetical protein